MKKIQVVAAIIEKNGTFLLGKRSPHKTSTPYYWCPITGRLEDGETQEEAVVREVMEEVGLSVFPIKRLFSFNSNDGTAEIHWWSVQILSGEAILKNDEHTEIRWVTLNEMKFLEPIFKEDLIAFQNIVLNSGN